MRDAARYASWRRLIAVVAFSSLPMSIATKSAALPRPPRSGPNATQGVDIDEKLGQRVPGDLTFTNADGQTVKLRQYLGKGRPVVLTLAYFRCPMLCDLVLRGMADTLKRIDWAPGRDYQGITVSIDPKDTPGNARVKKLNVLRAMARPQNGDGWAFLVDAADSARRLADAVGFRYQYDAKTDQYAHPAVAIVLTPDGRIARYLYGVAFRPLDVRLALSEASKGKIGGIVERVLLTCFRYDPATRRYGFFVNSLLKGGAGLVLLLVMGTMVRLWRYDHRRQQRPLGIGGGKGRRP